MIAFETKGLRKILRVSRRAKKTNESVLNRAGVKRELLDTVKARKLAYYGHTMRKQGSCLKKETMQGTMPGARRRGRPRTAWMDNIKTWTRLPVREWPSFVPCIPMNNREVFNLIWHKNASPPARVVQSYLPGGANVYPTHLIRDSLGPQ